jgi:hypothetical protein
MKRRLSSIQEIQSHLSLSDDNNYSLSVSGGDDMDDQKTLSTHLDPFTRRLQHRAPKKKRKREVPEEKKAESTVEVFFTTNDLNREECARQYRIRQEIASGSYGSAYEACKADDCRYVVKFIKVGETLNPQFKPQRRSQIEKEFTNARIAGQIGVGPVVHDFWFCEDKRGEGAFAVVVMDRRAMTLSSYQSKYPFDAIRYYAGVEQEMRQLVTKLLKAGITHNDLHNENIMLNIDPQTGKPVDIVIIDYGRSLPVTPASSGWNDLSSIQDMLDGYLRSATGQIDFLLHVQTLSEEDRKEMEPYWLPKVTAPRHKLYLRKILEAGPLPETMTQARRDKVREIIAGTQLAPEESQ